MTLPPSWRTYTGYMCVKELNIKLYFWHGKDWTMWLLLTYLTSSLRTLPHVVFDPQTNNYSPFHGLSHPSEIMLFLSLHQNFGTLSQLKFVRQTVFNILSRDWKPFYLMWLISAKLTLMMFLCSLLIVVFMYFCLRLGLDFSR